MIASSYSLLIWQWNI